MTGLFGILTGVVGGTLDPAAFSDFGDALYDDPTLANDFQTGHNFGYGLGFWSSVGLAKGRSSQQSSVIRLPEGGLSGNLVSQPKLLWGRSADDIAATLGQEGYQVAVRQSTRGSGNATIIKVDGHKEITQIQVHAGGGRHGGAYYKMSTSTQGKVWVVNPSTFRADPNQNGTIVSGVN